MALQDKLNDAIAKAFPPVSGAKGLEKIILKLCQFVVNFQFALDKIFYGKPEAKTRFSLLKKTNGQSAAKNVLNLGIIPILRILASVDYCQIITYALTKVPPGKFNPDKPPRTDEPKLVRSKWKIQKAAYDVQMAIDNFEADYLYANNPDSKNKLFRVIFVAKSTLLETLETAITESGTFYGTNYDIDSISTVYPQLNVFLTYIRNYFAYLDRFTDYRQINNATWQKIINNVKSIRQVCVLIQSLNTPLAFLSSLAVTGLLPGLYEQLERLNRIIKPEKAIETLKKIVEALRVVQRTCVMILNFIQLAQLIITIIIILIRVFRIIIGFFLLNPIPSIFLTGGIQTSLGNVVAIIKERGPTTFEKRLMQIVFFLTLLTLLIRSLLPILNEIIFNLTKIIATLQGCVNMDKKLLDDLISVRNQLQNSADLFYIFLKNKELNDIENGTYNPEFIPIDQLLANPGELDDTGIAASLGVGPTGNVNVVPKSNVSSVNADVNSLGLDQNSGTPSVGGNPVIGGPGGTFTPGVGGIAGTGITVGTGGGGAAITTTPTATAGGGITTPTAGGTIDSPLNLTARQIKKDVGDNNQDVGIPDDLKSAIDNVIRQRGELQPGKNITNPSTKLGEFTIEIITEEVVEKTFKLKRRYGVALNNRKEVVVQSSPTYASDSGLIIKQVQQLLLSKGLIKQSFSLYDPNEENTIKNATSYLYNKDVNWKNYPSLSNRMRARLGIDINGERIPTNNLVNPRSSLNSKASSGGIYAGSSNGQTQNNLSGPNSNIQSTNTAANGINYSAINTSGQAGVSGGGLNSGTGLLAGGYPGAGQAGAGGAGISAGTPGGTAGPAIPVGGTEPIGAATPVGILNTSTAANDSALNELYDSEMMDVPFSDAGIPGTEDFQINNFESFSLDGLGLENFLMDEFEMDAPDNEDENQGLGINAFINKLKGGRKLRRKMKQVFAKKLTKFKSDLKANDPQGKYGSNVGDKVGTTTNKLASADENTENGTVATQNNNVDLVTGDFAYSGTVLSNGSVVTTVNLRADDAELAKQKLIDKYDPTETKKYSYTITQL